MVSTVLPLLFHAALAPQSAVANPVAPEILGGYLYVDAVVNGVKGRFVVDTGASSCVLEPDFAAKAKPKVIMKVPVSGVGSNKVEADYGTLQQLTVGDQTEKDCEMVVLKLPSILQCDGLIGYPFLKNLTLKVDYSKVSIEFLRKHSRPGGNELKMIGMLPSISAKVLGEEGWMTVDTGASGTTFFNSFVDKHKLREKFSPRVTSVTGQGVGGFAMGEYIKMNAFSVGGHVIPTFEASFSSMKQGVFADNDKIGNLGSDVFRRFILTMDYPNKKIYLDKSEAFDKEQYGNGTGIAFDYGKEKCKILYIRPKSAADLAGIQMGQSIVAVNGKKVNEMRGLEIRELFSQKPGTEIEITVEKLNGSTDSKKLLLKSIFE